MPSSRLVRPLTRNKLINAYTQLDKRLAASELVSGDGFAVADTYVWTTMRHERSGPRRCPSKSDGPP